jgi:hypothetical protein
MNGEPETANRNGEANGEVETANQTANQTARSRVPEAVSIFWFALGFGVPVRRSGASFPALPLTSRLPTHLREV